MGKTYRSAVGSKQAKSVKPPVKLVGRDLKKINPKGEQFEPTDAQPIRHRARMGGMEI